jgi:glycerophosphoryl diester phosphodiesterase
MSSYKKHCAAGVLGLLAMVAAGGVAKGTEIIAHRGASYDAPENTLPAVTLGWQQQADAVEVDVHLSKDGRIVVMHDYDTGRTAGLPKKITEQTLEDLRRLDVGSWKDQKWAGTRIPLLEEVIATIPPGKKKLFIEVKCGEEIVPELKRVVERSGKEKQLVVIAFSYEVVRSVKKVMPYLPVYWLYSFREDGGRPVLTHEELIARVKEAGLDGLDVSYRGPLTQEFMNQLRAANLGLYVYTVNDPGDARRLAALGVTGITTDRPAYLRDALSSAPQR